MKEQLLYDIILGFVLLSLWLNFFNGSLPAFISGLPKQVKLSLFYFTIILLPFFIDFAFNYSTNSSQTFSASILSAVIALMTRALFEWWKERNDIREEMFSELKENYRSLYDFTRDSYLLENIDNSRMPNWNKSLIYKWTDRVFDQYFGKIQAKNIYSQESIEKLKNLYEFMSGHIGQIKDNNPSYQDTRFVVGVILGADHLGALAQIKDLLISLDKKRAVDFLAETMELT